MPGDVVLDAAHREAHDRRDAIDSDGAGEYHPPLALRVFG